MFKKAYFSTHFRWSQFLQWEDAYEEPFKTKMPTTPRTFSQEKMKFSGFEINKMRNKHSRKYV